MRRRRSRASSEDVASGRVWQRTKRLHALILVVALHQLVGTGFIAFFSWYFGWGRRFVVFHSSLIAVTLLVVVLCLGALVRLGWARDNFFSRLALSSVLGAASAALVFLYATDFITNRLWGGNINYQLVQEYALWTLISSQALVPVIIVVWGVISTIYFGFFRSFLMGVQELFLPWSPRIRSVEPRHRARALVLACLLVGPLATLVLLSPFMIEAGLLHRDPLVGFFRETGDAGRFGWFTDFQQQKARVAQEGIAYLASVERQPRDRRNVVLIIVDSLRADHMQVYGYERPTTPFLSRLQRDGRLRKVTTVLPLCVDSACGILTTLSGQYNSGNEATFKISDLLGDQRYNTYFILAGRHSWDGLRQAYGDELTLYFDGSYSRQSVLDDDRVVFEGLNRVPPSAQGGSFFYVHLMSSHAAGLKLPEYRRFNPSADHFDLQKLLSNSFDRETLTNSYDNGVLQADAIIEAVFSRLEALGYLKNSIVMIVSDHGERLGEKGRAGSHTDSLIPWLIYDDASVNYRNLDFGTQADVAPTIVARLGLKSPPSWEGRSLLTPATESYSYIHHGRDCLAVVHWQPSQIYKLLRCASRPEELYELTADPHEEHNLSAIADPAIVGTLREKIARIAAF